MSNFQYVFMGLLLVAMLPAVYAIARGWMQTPEPKVQRRAAIAMLISAIGVGVAVLAGGIGQLIEGKLLLAVASGLCLALLVIAVLISRTHLRAARHLVNTGERLELTEAEERRNHLWMRIMLGLAVVIVALFVVGIVTGLMGVL